MRTHPDLTYPTLPDAQDDLPLPQSSRPVGQGGMSLRHNKKEGDGDEEYQWPEAGPSTIKREPTVGPFGAKAVAAMTGAMATSLLMTPFDVLKTRLQTVPPQPRPEVVLNKVIQPQNLAEECCQTTLLTSTSPGNIRSSSSSSSASPMTCQTSASTSSALHSSSTNTQHLSFGSLRPNIPSQPPEGCLHPSKWAGIWGEALTLENAFPRSQIMQTTSAGGLGTLALPIQAGTSQRISIGIVEQEEKVRGFFSELATVRREHGIRGLWKGVGTAITMGIPSSAIYMLGYETLLTSISPYFTGSSDPLRNTSSLNRPPPNQGGQNASITTSLTPAPLVAGSLARTLSATVISPIEMFRTRLQALPCVEKGSPTYASTAKDMSVLVRSKGITILWRGLGPTLWRDVPFSGIYWAGFEIFKSFLISPSSPLPHLSPIQTSFLSGFVSGTISAIVTQPFDVLKTRRQVFNPSPGCTTTRAATIPLALHVIRTEGYQALYAGLSARCGKTAPACGLMIACYEGVGRYLGGTPE
ncbi:uncharacterized protein IL334_000286 [Kwoniella shivajii]|uniref:Uncharacterized protein n=1 Tax=Kwoniella shivajii TaxID=564305 RepID=A0ABZ1CRS0_9TREE|nr:hypothetical protein IL334_000286 [Kwoniella shivajii]